MNAPKTHSAANGAGIIALVAAHFGVPVRCLTGAIRAQRYTRPRFIAMALIRDYLGYSTPQIGRLFGNRDHTTVLAALTRAAELVAADPILAAKVDILRGALDLHEFGPGGGVAQPREMAAAMASAFRASIMAAADANPDTFMRGARVLLTSLAKTGEAA